MSDHRTSAEIERELEQERADLAETLDDLKGKFSLDALFRQSADQFREHGGEIGASLSRSVRDNPMAVALTGIGLAWLVLGDRSGSGSRSDRGDPYRSRDRSLSDGYDSRPAPTRGLAGAYETPNWARDAEDFGDDSQTGGTGFGARARAGFDKAGEAASDASHTARDRMHSTAETARDRAASLRDRLAEGTEDLTEEGRARVIAARQKVHDARDAAMSQARKGQARATDLFEEQPLIAGALALAVGAAIGAALPRTRFEDEHFGEQSDAMMRDAERIFSEEREKVSAVAGAAMDEARDIADETRSSVEDAARRAKSEADRNASGDTAAQDVADRTRDGAKDAGQRIADRAKSEAERQDLGKFPS